MKSSALCYIKCLNEHWRNEHLCAASMKHQSHILYSYNLQLWLRICVSFWPHPVILHNRVAYATRLRHQLWLCLSTETLSTPREPVSRGDRDTAQLFPWQQKWWGFMCVCVCVCVSLPWPLMAEAQGFFKRERERESGCATIKRLLKLAREALNYTSSTLYLYVKAIS